VLVSETLSDVFGLDLRITHEDGRYAARAA
jgi:hypothetical protein